uniref:Uncharacterized protein n=1 Tax=Globodera rostochiensis TaxID=31243 RepID=A0A914IEX2_GLORO
MPRIMLLRTQQFTGAVSKSQDKIPIPIYEELRQMALSDDVRVMTMTEINELMTERFGESKTVAAKRLKSSWARITNGSHPVYDEWVPAHRCNCPDLIRAYEDGVRFKREKSV